MFYFPTREETGTFRDKGAWLWPRADDEADRSRRKEGKRPLKSRLLQQYEKGSYLESDGLDRSASIFMHQTCTEL